MAAIIEDRRSDAAALAFRLVLGFGLVLCLATNLPGHLTLDSVVSLTEARTGVRQTWAPVISSGILKPFDRLVPGAGLYVAASAAVLFGALMTLPALHRRTSWMAAPLALLAIFTPQLLVYQGIVWRDVLFANLAVAGFVALAHAAADPRGPRPGLPLAAAVAAFALAALSRQNGLLLLIPAAAVVGVQSARGQASRGALWAVGFLAATAIVALGVDRLAQPSHPGPKLRPRVPVLILQHYDIIGALAHDPSLRLDVVRAADPAGATALEVEGRRLYSPARVDTLDGTPAFRKALWKLPDAVMDGQWRSILKAHPEAYLAHRADVFWQVLATPDLKACLPVAVGVTGPPAMLAPLGIEPGADLRAQAAGAYAARFFGGPVYSHLAWAALAVVLMLVLLRRGRPQDRAVAALLGGSLMFAASFAAISVACDYRYLYILDLAAIAAALYVALDPRGVIRP